MKFDSSLSPHENVQRLWKISRESIRPRGTWKDLLPDELETLWQLNATLVAIEQRYTAESAHLNPALKARTARIEAVGHGRFHQIRLADGDVRLSDFELELQIEFWMKETDPEWDDADENVLWYTQKLLTSRVPSDQNFGFGCFHVDHRHHGDPFPQCWLFHQLVHAPLHLRDLLRIGSIWCDMVTTEQRLVVLSDTTTMPQSQ
jgi:hypothetical protein